jgi:hypothetical protein
MPVVNPSQSNAGDTIEAADINTPVNQIAAVVNGAIDATNLASSAVTTAKIADDAVTDAKLVYGKVRSRQGGSASNWSTAGTTTYDYSATDTFMQAGAIAVTSDNFVVTFPTAFNQVPIVVATTATAAGANAWVECLARTATTATFRVINNGGVVTSETIHWIAIGQ